MSLIIMGKEQDLLVAVKTGDLLLAHKLLSKVKCSKTSEYETNDGMDCCFIEINFLFVACFRAGSEIVSSYDRYIPDLELL